jgi:Uma2 family endonuclease
MILAMYARRTPGVRASDNTTVLLGDKSEPQPDLLVRILPECGGQSSASEGYVKGAPELIIEIAHSSIAVDLHDKKDDYANHGVREYVVICVGESRLRWFDLTAARELQADSAGIFRIQVFPGLWINGLALLSYDYDALIQTLDQGLATPEHAAFVEELAKRRVNLP